MERDFIQKPVDQAYAEGIQGMNQPAGGDWLEAVAKALTGTSMKTPTGTMGTMNPVTPEVAKYVDWVRKHFPALGRKVDSLQDITVESIVPHEMSLGGMSIDWSRASPVSRISIATPKALTEIERLRAARDIQAGFEPSKALPTMTTPYSGFIQRLLQAVHLAKPQRWVAGNANPLRWKEYSENVGPSLNRATNKTIAEHLLKQPWDPNGMGYDPGFGAVSGMTENMLKRFIQGKTRGGMKPPVDD